MYRELKDSDKEKESGKMVRAALTRWFTTWVKVEDDFLHHCNSI